MTPVLTLTDAPDASAEAVIGGGLERFNAQQAGYSERGPSPSSSRIPTRVK